MRNFSDELLCRIKKARKNNAIMSFFALFLIGFGVWLYQYSGLDIPYYVNALVTLVVIVVGNLTYDYINSLAMVYCPKCNAVVEKGRMIGDSIPLFCPKCGLVVSSK